MKVNRRTFTLILFIFTALAVFMTFSCTGLFSSPDTKPGMGTLTIALPGAGARLGFTGEDVDIYKISIISQTTGEPVVPTQEAEPGTFLKEIPVGTYSIIVQGMISSFPPCIDLGIPFYIGRTNNVSVSEGETTNAEIFMVEYHIDGTELTGGANANLPRFFDYGSGKLPIPDPIGCTFDGWYTDETLTTKITQWPDTSDWENYKNPYLKLTISGQGGRGPRHFETGDNIFFVTQDGNGDGKTPDSPTTFTNAINALEGGQTLYLLEDINLGSNPSIRYSVTIIGAGGEDGWDKVTVTSSSQASVVNFTQSNTSYTIWNVIIDGQGQRTGISANGSLTLDDCVIRNGKSTDTSYGGGGIKISSSYTTVTLTDCKIENCSATKEGGGIYNAGSLTLNGTTSISNCTATEGSSDPKGNLLYCSSNAKVNGQTLASENWINDQTSFPYNISGWEWIQELSLKF